VERALNSDDLADALGQHGPGVLPTVEELTDLIADVEIRTFRQDFQLDAQLLETAWYLHGVASAPSAVEAYTATRQRRAFAVSAHIFDLALGDDSRSVFDRLTLAFGAQVGYRRSELDPNATAVYRRVRSLLSDSDDLTGHAPMLALEAGVAFLGLDTPRISPLLRVWRGQLNELSSTVAVDDLRGTMFGPGQQVVTGVSALLSYLRNGINEQLGVARQAFTDVIDRSAGVGDLSARWVAAHLLALTDGLEVGSVWALLPADVPDAVAQAFTLGTPPVLTLWPPQRELLARTTSNPLDPSTSRLLLSVPTSAGKTLLAQLIICTHLATQTGDVCYITPLRSLGREMRQALRSRLRLLDKGLGRDLPDESIVEGDPFDDTAESRGDVEVMTPERLMQLLRRDSDGVRSRFSLFVADEAQLLAQPGRGFLLESLLAYLKDGPARLVLLSAVLGNAAGLASWLDATESNVLFTSQWRGPRRMHVLLNARPLWGEAVETPRQSKARPVRVTIPLVAHLRLRPAEGRTVSLTTTRENPIGTLVLNQAPDRSRVKDNQASTTNYRMAAAIAAFLLHAGSLLMIVSDRNTARLAADALAAELTETSASRDLAAFVSERLGSDHPLVRCVTNGVAYHHAGLPVDILDALEEGLRSGALAAVVATSTLSEGVNLPVRTVLVAETNYAGAKTGQLDAARLLNAIGRAGRAGRESEGWIVLSLQQEERERDFKLLAPTDEALTVRSTLLTDAALNALAEAEALLAKSTDALFALPVDGPREFTGYVWFLLTSMEQLGHAPYAVNLPGELDKLLAFAQMAPELRQRWVAFAETIRARYDATPPDVRRRWTAAGTTLGTAATLDHLTAQITPVIIDREHAITFHDQLEEIPIPLDETIDLLAQADAFTTLLTQADAPSRPWTFRPTRGWTQWIDVPLLPSLKSWLDGRDMPDLADEMLPDVPAEWRLEQVVDAVSAVFEHYFAWTIGVLVDQVNAALAEAGAKSRLRPDTGWCIRYGVDTTQAFRC